MLITTDVRNWHANIEQHASAGVNKILLGNKCDWDEKRAVKIEDGRALADEFGLRFLETSAKANEGVEQAFYTIARYVSSAQHAVCSVAMCRGAGRVSSCQAVDIALWSPRSMGDS